ncbi:cytochrome P450 family protein [Tieghemostelium lacteum]|uniref:Cytochrome P450 family protein n=1 Tax=Tieghemostelium lacteum TaxID=361077 RepID=A0A152A3X5_TIELA|nr:cytochrome P450 family protein [Tieghemostelium lacteum]|eukprot:KYR00785.1 cytochrome P450 family protein [Tieghemostelium lacteum]
MDFTLLFISIIVFLFILIIKSRSKLDIPGPRGIPVFGNLLQLGKKPHETMLKLYLKYGNVFSLRFGAIDTVILSEPEIIKQAFMQHGDVFNPRFVRKSRKATSNEMNLASSNGEYWKTVRGLVAGDLTASKLKQFETQIQEESDLLCQYFKDISGQCEQPHTFLKMYSLNNVLRFTFSLHYPYDSNSLSVDIIKNIHDYFITVGQAFPQDYIPILYPFFKNSPKKYFDSYNNLFNYIQSVLKDKESTFDKSNPKDLMETLIVAFDKLGLPQSGVSPTCLDILVAGADTTSYSLIFLLMEMLNNPNIQDKLHSELAANFSLSQEISYKDRSKTPYLNACLKEIQRLYPTAPLGVPHITSKDIEFCGYKIPKDTQVLVNIYGTHRSPKIWDQPLLYKPTRFLSEHSQENNSKICIFGFGSRNCVGFNLAEQELYIVAAKLFRRFQFKRPLEALIDTSTDFGLTLGAKDYKCIIEKRIV